jgi:hypothetical protein
VTVTKVKKPKNAPTFKQDFKIKVTVTAAGTTPKGRVVLLYKGVKIGKGKLVKGKVTITVTKNLKVGKQKLVAKYKGSPTTLKSTKRFTITIVALRPDHRGPAGTVRRGLVACLDPGPTWTSRAPPPRVTHLTTDPSREEL